jgi:hypothetical protein
MQINRAIERLVELAYYGIYKRKRDGRLLWSRLRRGSFFNQKNARRAVSATVLANGLTFTTSQFVSKKYVDGLKMHGQIGQPCL